MNADGALERTRGRVQSRAGSPVPRAAARRAGGGARAARRSRAEKVEQLREEARRRWSSRSGPVGVATARSAVFRLFLLRLAAAFPRRRTGRRLLRDSTQRPPGRRAASQVAALHNWGVFFWGPRPGAAPGGDAQSLFIVLHHQNRPPGGRTPSAPPGPVHRFAHRTFCVLTPETE